MNKTEAAELEKKGEHVFYHPEDVPFIESFMRRIAAQTSVIYEGSWTVDDDYEAHRDDSILNLAFNNDDQGTSPTTSGKLRTFFTRSNVSTRSVEDDYLGTLFGRSSSQNQEKSSSEAGKGGEGEE